MKLPIVTGNTFTLIVDLRKESPFVYIYLMLKNVKRSNGKFTTITVTEDERICH